MLVGLIFVTALAIVTLGVVTWYHIQTVKSLVEQAAAERSVLEDRVADAMHVQRPTPVAPAEPIDVEPIVPDWYVHVGRAMDKVPEAWVATPEDS